MAFANDLAAVIINRSFAIAMVGRRRRGGQRHRWHEDGQSDD
ncbi:MAG: hypothetical protein ACRDVM_00845 [Acidimicrobiia bacterium]